MCVVEVWFKYFKYVYIFVFYLGGIFVEICSVFF
jgi:hypothetical protein